MGVKSPSLLDKDIGARIRLHRTLAGMSQEALGDILGLTFQQVQKYEKGINRIAAARLQNVADAFGIPVTTFFENPGSSSGGGIAPDIQAFLSSREGYDLVQAFLKIENPAMRRALLDTARAAGPSAEP